MDRNPSRPTKSMAALFSAHLLKKNLQGIPDWPTKVSGFTYAPFRPGQSPSRKRYPSRVQIEEDLLLIRPFTRNVRTYSVEGSLAWIPEVAQTLGMTVTLGAWISQDEKHNDAELNTAIELVRRYTNIDRLLIGNEALYREDTTLARLVDYMTLARRQVSVPVSTSEAWSTWVYIPELARQSDFIAAHVLPFWQTITAEYATSEVMARAEQLHQLFPDKPILLSEVGWPSRGSATRRTFSSRAEQSACVRSQLHALNHHGYDYFVVEAFDQPWKTHEGPPGPHWGLFDTQRKLKIQLNGPVQESLDWRLEYHRLIAALRPRSRHCAIAVIAPIYCILVAAGLAGSASLPSWVALPLSLGWACSLLISVALEVHEWMEACWGSEHNRVFPSRLMQDSYSPKVSLHVPCYNEPSDMVILTLDALHRLDYPDFEVLVIDNNTQDPEVWKPVERHCHQLGTHFRFFHVDPLSGFKAGALNYLLDRTAADAEIIAVIDADYCVNRLWLRHMVPHFADARIGVIQSPQDYRDGDESFFKRCCKAEYRGFFNIGMVIRNDHDAIIQHGTMTMIRRSLLQRLRWAHWSISEDAELGLRIIENDFSTGYNATSYGKGLIPDTFTHFKKQRYRWAYGAVQILKRHANSLIAGNCGSLNATQRYYYLAGWAPWAAEGINFVLTLIVLPWTMAMILAPELFGPLPWIFTSTLVLIFILRSFKIILLYLRVIGCDIQEALASALAGMALHPTIGKAVISGIFTSRLPFFRTPKQTAGSYYTRALSEAGSDLGILLLFWMTAIGLCFSDVPGDADLLAWIAILVVKSLPYLAAVVMAALSAHARRTTHAAT
ncbi:glycosyltransferase family 2 protein [Pseudomonas viridiflava]|uniref:glycosyltransferase family 2 protein n=1 Tax=Pseudomonas viridiflava TaxID=33069 RepID=UPI001F134F8E|nr:glycosyltransferase family 2 protein [Pseudomonas viridiflava]